MCMSQSGLYDKHTPKSQLFNKIKGANLLGTPAPTLPPPIPTPLPHSRMKITEPPPSGAPLVTKTRLRTLASHALALTNLHPEMRHVISPYISLASQSYDDSFMLQIRKFSPTFV